LQFINDQPTQASHHATASVSGDLAQASGATAEGMTDAIIQKVMKLSCFVFF
jgi:hypothetical protein